MSRGGGWGSYDCRASVRGGDTPSDIDYTVGFRAARNP
jgi:formylglycine-generating enzyme required for sulfatase activity